MMDEPENRSIYSDRYVAFVDILGFSSIVRNSAQSPYQAAELVRALDRISERWSNEALKGTHEMLGSDFKAQAFSDCTVLSEAATPKGLHYLLLMVSQFALDLMAIGFLVRGGIAKGGLYHSKHAVFGPAFLDAYALERDIAKYPRIIVDQHTHQDYVLNKPPETWDKFIRPVLRHDDDGPVFVDVLAPFRFVDEGNIPSRILVNGRACRASIQKQLDASIYNPAHYEKLRWLTLYWNAVRQNRMVDLLEPIEFPVWREYRFLNAPGPQ
jgi:hypothetical protein